MFEKGSFKKSFLHSIPVGIGYLPLGFICGVFLGTAGLSTFQIGLMSFLVYGGSAQFIAASMISSLASIPSIVVAVFITNLRQMLYASSLSIHIREKNIWKLLGISHWCTDETYAISYEQYEIGQGWSDDNTFLLGFLSHSYWVLSNILGSKLGSIIKIPSEIASFTLIALFIALIILQLNNKIKVIVAVFTVLISIIIINLYQSNLNIILIAILGASLGYILESRGRKE